MQAFVLMAVIAAFIWVIFTWGIELALVLASAISGSIWLLYLLARRLGMIERVPTESELRRAHEKAQNEDQTTAPEPLGGMASLVDHARSFFPIFLVVLLLRSFIAEPFRIPSGSMIPTLLVGDFIIVNKFAYGLRMPVTKTKIVPLSEPERGDIAVFRFPIDNKTDYIKRIVGVPGDKISYHNKTLFVNGEPMRHSLIGPYQGVGGGARSTGSLEVIEDLNGIEHSILVDPRRPRDFHPSCTFLQYREIVVPEGHYFAMGDNRDDSNDSRCWGFVPEENLVGKAYVIWLNFDLDAPGVIDFSRIGQLVNSH